MTAPPTYQTGQPGATGAYQPGTPNGMMRRRPPSSPGGDGGFDANGVQQMPGQMPGQGAPPRQRFQTSHPPQPQGGAGGSAPPPTFAQMQAQGQARPAPPPQSPSGGQMMTMQTMQAPANRAGALSSPATEQGVNDSLNSAVQQALQTPSAYGSQQVQDVYRMLTQNLGQDYDYQRKQLNDEMAKRGLSESTIAGQRYSDLATEQARAQANIATQLATQAAQTYGQDRLGAINAGLGVGNLGLGQQSQDLARELGLGNLGVAQQNAETGRIGTTGQLGLGQQQQDLAKQLGLGNLDLNRQQLQQQGSQFGQSLDLQKQLGLGNLGLQQQQLTQSGSQFDRSLALDQQKNAQQFGLQQADLTGSYNGQSTLASRAQSLAQQQFQQQLAQALGIATMQDKTTNRGIDAQGVNNTNQLMMQLAMLGIGGNMASSVASLASGGAGGGGTAGAATVPPAIKSLTDNPALQQTNPQLYASLVLSGMVPNVNLKDPGWANQTINFGGKQYSPTEYYTLMAQHPELFGVQKGAAFADNAAWNDNFFKNSTQTGGGELATAQYPQTSATPTDPIQTNGFTTQSGYTTGQWNDRAPTFADTMEIMQRNGATPSILAQIQAQHDAAASPPTPTATAYGTPQYTAAQRSMAQHNLRQDFIESGRDPSEISEEDILAYLRGV